MMTKSILFVIMLSITIPGRAQSLTYKNLESTEFDVISRQVKGTVLDVRTPAEYANGHIESAGQLDYYASDFKRKLLLLPKDQPVYLYCNTGYRSKKAADILIKNGFTQVYNLESGIMEWNLHELPVVVEKDARPDTENQMEWDEYFALINSDKPVFIDFYAPWCGPCRKMMPMIDGLAEEYKGKVSIVKINADASKKLVKELQIIGVPHFVLYASGNKIYEHSGIITKTEVTDLLEAL